MVETQRTLEDRLAHIEAPITLAINGRMVNGPGEAQTTGIGIAGGGAGRHIVGRAGKTGHAIAAGDLLELMVELVEAKAAALRAEKEAALEQVAAE